MALVIALLLQTQSRGGIFTGKGGLFHDDERAYLELVEDIKARESILFEGEMGATFAVPAFRNRAIATPTGLYFDDGRWLPYSFISSVRVGVYAWSTKEEPGWEDILILNENIGYLLIPDNETRRRGEFPKQGSPERRALADRLAEIIETHRHTVDVFGKALPPRTVDLALVDNEAFFEWVYPPRYLDTRHKEERKAFDELWKSARDALTETFLVEMRELLVNRETGADAYAFHYAGEFRYGSRFNHPRINAFGPDFYENMPVSHQTLQFEDLVTLGPISLWFEEKMDPQGIPSVNVTMWVPCNLFDSAREARTRPSQRYVSSIRLTLEEWLEGGQERIIAEVKACLREIVTKVELEIGSKAQKERLDPANQHAPGL